MSAGTRVEQPAYLDFAPRLARFANARSPLSSPPPVPPGAAIAELRARPKRFSLPHFPPLCVHSPPLSIPLPGRPTTKPLHVATRSHFLSSAPSSFQNPTTFLLDARSDTDSTQHAGRTHSHSRRACSSPRDRECPSSVLGGPGLLAFSYTLCLPCPGAHSWPHGSDECCYITICRERGRGGALEFGSSHARSPTRCPEGRELACPVPGTGCHAPVLPCPRAPELSCDYAIVPSCHRPVVPSHRV